ncbi:MAG: hypothetical protein WAV41_02795 [Microgenomates group bacterium]
MGFKPELERNYLANLSPKVRRNVLVEELATAAGESCRFTFEKTYEWHSGEVIDQKSGEPIGEVLGRKARWAESQAWKQIEPAVVDEDNLIINFSPANIDFDYPMTVVDFWRRSGETVTWSRATLEDSFETLTEIYRGLGGGEVSSKEEMLARPIVIANEKPNNILDKLHLVGEKVKITQKNITKVAELIVDDFVKKFGKDFLLKTDKIFRAYSAVMMEVKNLSRGIVDKISIGAQRLYDYAFRPLIVSLMQTFGCSLQTMVGEFAKKNGLGVEKYFRCPKCKGKIKSGEGTETCPHCGMTKQEAGSVCD